MLDNRNKTTIIAVGLVFFLFIIVGLSLYKDYGVSIDEPTQRNHSIVTYRWLNRIFFDRGVFVNEGSEDLDNYENKYYGVAIQLPLVFIEDVYQVLMKEPMPTNSIYKMRHLYTYLFYILSLYCFYRLLFNLFDSKILGLIGVLMIYSFGRFFAHSFYNIKDMMFASLFMIDLYFVEKVVSSEYEKKWCLFFSIVSAFMVSSRIVGALLPLFVLLLPIVRIFFSKNKFPLSSLGIICLAYPIWLLITPASWSDPIRFSINCASTFSDYNLLEGNKLFGGQLIPNGTTPFDFYLRWMWLTIPLVYHLFAVIGLIACPIIFFTGNHKKKLIKNPSFFVIAGCTLLFTLLYQIIRQPSIYNDWRHVFFLYPILILFAVFCLNVIMKSFSFKVRTVIAVLLSLSIIYNLFMIIQNHPYEYNAYNPIGQRVAVGYEADYWGSSIYQHLLWVAEHNSETKTVKMYYPNRVYLRAAYLMLTEEQQNQVRIPNFDTDYQIVWLSYPMDYYWTDSKTGSQPVIDGYEEVNTIISYGIKISSLYQKID